MNIQEDDYWADVGEIWEEQVRALLTQVREELKTLPC